VQAGETLYSISRENQISVAQITDYNQLASNEIKVGQMLIVGETPEEVSETTISEIVETPILTENQKSPEKQTHTVQKGDTLYSISRNYGCTVSDLKEWNQKTDNALKIGENIVIFVK
jgi:membrane-bound lytic murein transglycosylase D